MPSQNKPQKGQRNENIAENVLQGASLTLQTVQQVAVFTTVPYLSDAAGLVLKIFEIVQVWPVYYRGPVPIFMSSNCSDRQ